MTNLQSRLTNRIQISSDGLQLYVEAVEESFGADVGNAQIVKSYEAEPIGPGRYTTGNPDVGLASTSYVERQNLTMRMSMRRFTRLTNAFSKKAENLKAEVALHFAHYNFVRVQRTLKVTPAMEAGITDRIWSIREIISPVGI